jgi:hypothetical protein
MIFSLVIDPAILIDCSNSEIHSSEIEIQDNNVHDTVESKKAKAKRKKVLIYCYLCKVTF